MNFKKIIKGSLATTLIFATAAVTGCKNETTKKHDLIEILENNMEERETENSVEKSVNKLVGYSKFSVTGTEIIQDYSEYGLLVTKTKLGFIGFYSLNYQKYLIEPQAGLTNYKVYTDNNLGYFVRTYKDKTYTIYDSLGNIIYESSLPYSVEKTTKINNELYVTIARDLKLAIERPIKDKIELPIIDKEFPFKEKFKISSLEKASIAAIKLELHFKYNEDYSLTKVSALPEEIQQEVTKPTSTDNTLTFGDQYASQNKVDLSKYGVEGRYLVKTNNTYSVTNKTNIIIKSFSIPNNAQQVYLIGNNLIYQTFTVDSLNPETANTNLEKTYAINLKTLTVTELDLSYLLFDLETMKDENGIHNYGIAHITKMDGNELEVGYSIVLIDENGKILEDLTKYESPQSFIKVGDNFYNEETKILYDSKLKEIAHLESINPVNIEYAKMFVGQENGKYGAISYDGKVLIPFIYDSLNPLDDKIDLKDNCLIAKKGNDYYSLNLSTGAAKHLGTDVKKLYNDLYVITDQTANTLSIISQNETYITFGSTYSQSIDVSSITSIETNKMTMSSLLGEYVVTEIQTASGTTHYVVNSITELKNASTFETIQAGNSGLYENGTRVMTWYELAEKYPDAFEEEGKILANIEGAGTYKTSFLAELEGELIIDESITEIEDAAFLSCSKLTSITLPSKITTIGFSTFKYCSSLTSIKIPSNVTTIENNAFAGTTIKEVIIDANITASMIENSELLSSARNLYIKNSIVIEDLTCLEENFMLKTDSNLEGYKQYTRVFKVNNIFKPRKQLKLQ